jgi:hypothetical protein
MEKAESCPLRLADALVMFSSDGVFETFHTWGVDDLLAIADSKGKPMFREDAIGIIETLFDEQHSSKDIAWQSLEAAVRDYHLEHIRIDGKKESDVHGVFTVWSEHNPIAHQFGLFPNKVDGNFTDAFDFAWWFAQENYGREVFFGCESSTGADTNLWLIFQYWNGRTTITESEM